MFLEKACPGWILPQPQPGTPRWREGSLLRVDPGDLGSFFLAHQPCRPHLVPKPTLSGWEWVHAALQHGGWGSGQHQVGIWSPLSCFCRILTVGLEEKSIDLISPTTHPSFFFLPPLPTPAIVNFSALQILSSEKSSISVPEEGNLPRSFPGLL